MQIKCHFYSICTMHTGADIRRIIHSPSSRLHLRCEARAFRINPAARWLRWVNKFAVWITRSGRCRRRRKERRKRSSRKRMRACRSRAKTHIQTFEMCACIISSGRVAVGCCCCFRELAGCGVLTHLNCRRRRRARREGAKLNCTSLSPAMLQTHARARPDNS